MRNGEGIDNGKKKKKKKTGTATATATIGLISKKTTFYILQTNVLKTIKNLLLSLMLYKWKKVAAHMSNPLPPKSVRKIFDDITRAFPRQFTLFDYLSPSSFHFR